MDAIKMLFGWIHLILALLVAVQFLAAPIYETNADDIWEILYWLMAIGVIAAVVFSFVRAREGDESDAKSANRAMALSIAVALLFLENWFSATLFGSASGSARDLLGILIPVLFVVVNRNVGLWLLRST